MSLDFGRIDTILKIKPSSDTLGRLTALKDGRTGTLIDGSTGNRLSAKVGTATQIYSYPTDSHYLSAVAGVARTYDANSNTTAMGGTARQYTYDTTGRMTQARRAGAVTMNYRYNGKGEQIRRFLGTTNTYTLYDEAGHWLGDYDSNGAPKQQAIWLDDLPVGLLANANKLHYIEPDHLGSPRVVIDPTRDVAVWTWSLKGEAFGNTAPDQDPDGNGAALVFDMRFPGQRFDAASGLNQNYFRDYDATTGRYEKSDPIGLAGGFATYAYSTNNPSTMFDRFGLCWSNARSLAHYFGGGGSVSVNQIGCSSIIEGKIDPARNIWKAKAQAAARETAYAMNCGTSTRISANRSVGVSSGIFWIGGFSLLQDSNCVIQKKCGSTAGTQCSRDSFTFNCFLTSRMNDLFENPSDFDNSGYGKNPDFWDEYSYGGTKFNVTGTWEDRVSGGGTL